MNIAEIQFALDKHGFRLIDKLPNGELLVREKTPQENIKHKDGIEEEDFYRAWNAGQVRRVSDGQIMNPQIKDAPPQRPWVGLTPEEVQFYALKHRQLVNAHYDAASDTSIITAEFEAIVFYDSIEAALRSKNT